ncbi:MAG: sodium:calcium antiporter [Candidatus Andersenbacteria bacterium]
MIGLLLTLIGSLAVLVVSSRYTIRLLNNVAVALGISEFTVAFIILAVATSIPELSLSVISAANHAGELVLATALGSNVINMTLIIGTAAVVSLGISTQGLKLKRDLVFGGITTCMPLLFLTNGVISRLEGGILIAAFCMYMYLLFREQRTLKARTPRHIMRGVGSMLLAGVMIAVIVFTAHMTVTASVDLARLAGLPAFLIGVFLLALGTSLPEFATTIQSALLKKPTMALGTILGSNVTDSALVIGIASVIQPIHVPINASLLTTVIFVIIALVFLGYFAATRRKISISEGLVLLLVFTLFIFVTFIVAPASS